MLTVQKDKARIEKGEFPHPLKHVIKIADRYIIP